MNITRIIFGLGIVLLSLVSISGAKAQDAGIGVRVGGFTSGISGKFLIEEATALEVILGTDFGRRGFQLTGLIEKHAAAFGVPRLQWFYGAGAHVGHYRGRYYHPRSYKHYYESADKELTTVGIDGIVGLEYHIAEIPISAGIDFKPFLDVNRDGLFLFPDGALTVRYTF